MVLKINHSHLFVTGFFDNVTDNTVGINFKTKDGSIAVFMRPDIEKHLASLEHS